MASSFRVIAAPRRPVRIAKEVLRKRALVACSGKSFAFHQEVVWNAAPSGIVTVIYTFKLPLRRPRATSEHPVYYFVIMSRRAHVAGTL